MHKSMRVPLVMALVLLSAASVVSAAGPAGETEMEARLKELYPSTRITAVRPSEVSGL